MKSTMLAGTAGLVLMTFSGSAVAQENDSAQDAANQPAGGLNTIVVTARRSAETLQDVPVAVTALSGDFIDRQNISEPTDVPQFAPNLTVEQQPSSLSAATIYIRGIGNQEPSAVSEQGVGIYLDGVYLARSAGAVFDLIDLERIEVLRGPQGTLFGRNTIGGALQFISKKPADSMGVTAKAGYGRFNEWYVKGRLDTGYIVGDSIKASISAQHREGDGYVNNTLVSSAKDPGALKANSVAVGIEGDFGDLTINYNFDWDKRDGTPGFFQIVATTPLFADYFSQSASYGGAPFLSSPVRQGTVQQAGFIDRSGDYRYTSKTKVQGHALTITYDPMPELTIKSITGYRKFFQDTILNLSGNGELLGQVVDFSSPTLVSVQPISPYTGNNAPQKQWQISQELQFLGKSGDFSYLVGTYIFHEKASEYNRQALTIVTPVAGLPFLGFPQSVADGIAALNPGLETVGVNAAPVQAFGGKSDSIAVFGQLTWKPAALNDRLEVTGGLRYTADDKQVYLAGDVNPVQRGRVSYDNVSWLASLSYEVFDDVMVYGRVSTGYRSGGINPRTNIVNTFAPEKATAYEVGLKSEMLNHRLRLNLAGYVTDYNDLQVQQFAAGTGGATSLIVNAGKVRLSGFEAELTALPFTGFQIDASVGYVNTNYKTFLFRDPGTNTVIDVADQARPLYTPKWSTHIGAEYSVPVGDALVRLRGDYSYRGKFYFNALDNTAPFNEQIVSPSSDKVKARLSVEDIKLGAGKLDLGIWGDNLLNQKRLASAIDFGALGFAGAMFQKPISYGVDARITF
ncbi:TonB-dependent receptor [Novosphingobium mathurense]|uniref:Iron complex outermembrane recepter protein n=1 Tax=Novosphingobium mathurense TaxID=428990 RepID=A0A1U6HY96_9SPHN|nr:TonB-dependent receptor [Novosphingobium mathurense]SLK00730.1 iron complex outermembrane recepter protein [Novosphingobium mathurense]